MPTFYGSFFGRRKLVRAKALSGLVVVTGRADRRACLADIPWELLVLRFGYWEHWPSAFCILGFGYTPACHGLGMYELMGRRIKQGNMTV